MTAKSRTRKKKMGREQVRLREDLARGEDSWKACIKNQERYVEAHRSRYARRGKDGSE